MKNPFRYGIAVDDPYFVNREQEICDFSKWLANGESLVIYSPRRFGKTSLILKVLNNLKDKGYRTVYIDFFKVHSRIRFVELYYDAIINAMPPWEKAMKKITNMVTNLRPVISLDQNGHPTVSVQSVDTSSVTNLSDVFDLPQKLAGTKPWIVVFDEFQEINNLNGESFEKELRASIIHHDKVGYAFMGSQMHMLLNMFTHRNRAFYQFGKIRELHKIDREIVCDFLVDRFEKSGFRPTKDICLKLIDLCNNIPHYVQYLASAVWEAGMENRVSINEDVLKAAVNKIVNNQNDYFFTLFENLTSYQQKVLKAIEVNGENILSSDYMERHRLKSTSSTQRAVERLVKDDIIEKLGNTYFFRDPFFKIWLQKM